MAARSALEIAESAESKILQASTGFRSLKPNVSRQLYTHWHGHATKKYAQEML